MRNMSDQQGNGFLDWIKQKIKNPRTLIPSLRDPSINPPLVRKWLEMHGREQITSIQVKRKPVQKAVQTFTNLLSFGQLNKAIKDLNYDDIFHLSLVINGKYEIDKKDVITEQNYNKENGEELIDVPLNGQYITIDSLIGNTQQYMGSSYGVYDPFTYNCQNWVYSVLVANRLDTPQLKQFIMQDSETIYKYFPHFATSISSFVSGKLAPSINRVIYGEGNNGIPNCEEEYEEPKPKTARQRLLEKMEFLEPFRDKRRPDNPYSNLHPAILEIASELCK